MVEHFKKCLDEHNTEAILSYQHELNINSLIKMHGICSPNVYLERMTKSASISMIAEE